MSQHIYFGVENLNLSDSQRAELVQALCSLGPGQHPQPCCLCHWRTRLDNDAAIFEALFNEDNISIQAFKNRLGDIFGVDPATIDHSTSSQTFDALATAIVTFSRGGVDYLRIAFFGYDGTAWPTWKQSNVECRAYLFANLAEWEEETI